MKKSAPVLIAGAGIAGLTLALALARRKIPSHILEAKPEQIPQGNGIQLSPNATRILIDLGMRVLLEPVVKRPESIIIRSGRHGRILRELPLGQDIEKRYGAPYFVIHRSDLYRKIKKALQNHSNLADVTYDAKVKYFQQNENGIDAITTNRKVYHGCALIGADGIHSGIRSNMREQEYLDFSGYIAWRSLINNTSLLSAPFRKNSISLWLGDKSHIVHYPLHKKINIVFVTTGNLEGKSTHSDELCPIFRNWHPNVNDFLANVHVWQRWPLFSIRTPEDRPWCEGKVLLIGDAAHPILPFLSQGGAMAIEDAVTLSACMAQADGDFASAFKQFENLRSPRVTKIQKQSKLQGFYCHLPRPLSFFRDSFIRLNSVNSGLSRYEWIYSGQPPVK
ncbi:MAG: FAD-dependent monooxygenase [Alphaproteobacteria bacterium]|nr:FAD-dependent monooxygenase [Alphaproteobacteria bacterium]